MAFLLFMKICRRLIDMEDKLLKRGMTHDNHVLLHLEQTRDKVECRARNMEGREDAEPYLQRLLEILRDYPDLCREVEVLILEFHHAAARRRLPSQVNVMDIFGKPDGVRQWVTTHH